MNTNLRNLKLFILLAFLPAIAVCEDKQGIVQDQPDKKPFVKTDSGYMVPYSVTIPGTDEEFEMVPIPGGKFLLGSPENEEARLTEEGPQIEVTVKPFWMGKYEITWGEYKEFMALHDIFNDFKIDGVREIDELSVDAVTAPSNLYEPSFTFGFGEHPRQPAITMTQFAAKQYTKWISYLCGGFYRLPSEAEWEYACRGGTKTRYYFGDDEAELKNHAWFEDNSNGQPQVVGQFPPNPFGLHDMHGNVAEWTLDAFSVDGYERLMGKSLQALDTVKWPTEIYSRVLRGGSWELGPDDCRSASRLESLEEWKDSDPNFPQSPYWYTNEDSGTSTGFRLLRPLSEPESKAAKNQFWKVHVDELWEVIVERSEYEGKGQFGRVDAELPAAIEGDQ